MVKKCIKTLVLAMILFFIFLTPSFAREMSLSDLGKKIEGEYYAYIIGDYVFTGSHILTTEDIMLAAKSIETTAINEKSFSQDIYDAMSIHYIEKEYEGDNPVWKVKENKAGKSTLNEGKINVRFIDYEYVKDMFTITLNTDNGNDYKDSIQVEEDGLISESEITGVNAPTKAGHQFKGWVKEGTEIPWNFQNDKVTGNVNLKATWYEEVNTNNLLKTFEQSNDSNSTYNGIKFDGAENKITFSIYDMNAENSEDTSKKGLENLIKAILGDTTKVKSVTITTTNMSAIAYRRAAKISTENTFIFENANGVDVNELIKAIVGEASSSVQGDLVNKTVTITITLKDEYRSQNNSITEVYTLEFIYEPHATLNKNDIPETEKTELKDKLKYDLEDTYDIIKQANGSYKVTGDVTKQKNVLYNGSNKPAVPGYYFAFVVKLDEGITTENYPNIKIKIPTDNENYKEVGKEGFVNNSFTILFQAEKNDSPKTRDIILDLDGEGKDYGPVKIRFDYSELNLKESSEVIVDKVENTDDTAWKGFKQEEGYSAEFSQNSENPSKIEVNGLITIFDDQKWQGQNNPISEASLYYLAFKLKKAEATAVPDSSTIVKFLQGDGSSDEVDKITGKDFGENNEIYVLKHISTDLDNATRTFNITIDLDKEDGKDEYVPYTVTIDWSALDFQQESKGIDFAVIGADTEIKEEDKAELQGYNYNYDCGKDIEMTDDKKITGKIREQSLTENTFKESTGYFIPLRIEFPSEDKSLEKYKNTWTLILNTEDEGVTKVVEPKQEDYASGYVMVLFKVKEGKNTISYKIDYDGEGNKFLPYEEKIDYTGLKFLEAHEVKFKDLDNTMTVWDEDVIEEGKTASIKPENEQTDYRKFVYWMTEDGTKFEGATISDEILDKDGSGNITLVPHWNLYSDKFISDVIDNLNNQESVNGKFKFEIDEQDSSKINIKVIDPETTLSKMNETNIFGTIAYVLLKNEIKDISLSVNEVGSKVFTKGSETDQNTLKDSIAQSVKDLYTQVLTKAFGADKTDENVTISDLANKKGYESFTIKINEDEISNTVTLTKKPSEEISLKNVEGVPTEYTFTFVSTIAIVHNETELKSALGNAKITDILVADSFELEQENSDAQNSHTLTIDIADRKVTIKSKDSDNIKTISDKDRKNGENDKTPVIEVKSGEVIFEDLKIEGATRAISVKSGAKVSAKNVSAIDSADTGFDVEKGATFTGEGLQYLKTVDGESTASKESYHYPTICGLGDVTVTDKQNMQKVFNYKRVYHGDSGTYSAADFTNPETGKYYSEFVKQGTDNDLKDEYQKLIDEKEKKTDVWDYLRDTGHTHYYLDPDNAKCYQIYLRDGAITRKYFVKGDEIGLASKNYKTTGFYKDVVVVDGKSYVYDGWSKQCYYSFTEKGRVYDSWGKPKVSTLEEAGDCTLYPRYVKGYGVTIEAVEGEDPITKRFGVKEEDEKTISQLMSEISEFKEAYEALKVKAEAQEGDEKGKIYDRATGEEINDSTTINKDLELVVGKPAGVQINSVGKYTLNDGKITGQIEKSETNGNNFTINFSSSNFQVNKTIVKVTDPNGEKITYKYDGTENLVKQENPKTEILSSVPANEIVGLEETSQSINLQLEAIKKANIKNNGDKIYNITVDVDGEKEDKFIEQNYIVNYEELVITEELINKAAENTQNAENLKYTKDNLVKDRPDHFTIEYDKNTHRRYYKEEDKNLEEYLFLKKEIVNGTQSNVSIRVSRIKNAKHEEGRVYLNDWKYCSKLEVGYGINELSLLKDLINDNSVVTEAISRIVKLEDQENTYEITINEERLKSWLNALYLDTEEGKGTVSDKNESDGVKLIVTLTQGKDGITYIGSIRTSTEFTIIDQNHIKTTNNRISVTIENIGETSVKSPQEMLGTEDKEATIEEIEEFLIEGQEWWEEYTNSTSG